jgi:hypothetical protein
MRRFVIFITLLFAVFAFINAISTMPQPVEEIRLLSNTESGQSY